MKKVTIDCDGKRIPETNIDNFPITLTVREIRDLIRKEPLAYDVDKVVEQLENLKNKVYREDGSLRASNKFIKADDAIEIVRKGGSE